MTEKFNEFVSAMLDDEADEFEIRRVLGEIAGNSDLKSTWSRYHVISSVLKREGLSNLEELDIGDASSGDIGSSFSRKTLGDRTLNRPWLRSRGTLVASLAAAIAALAIIITINDEGTTQVELADTLVMPDPIVTDDRVPAESDIRRAEAYLIQHAQHVSMNSSAAPIPFVKVIVHGTER
ncbi:MAG: sigma-E factor negative regulatory protein [Pseudomonadales bacterium]|nr:sigma-E factor negative regulatory protein [Pseudomonadales bacterium]